MRTKLKLEGTIKKLEKEKKGLPHYSVFGEDNWGSTDTYIRIIRLVIDESIDPQEKLDDILIEYGGNFPPYGSSDYWKVSVLDYILGHTEEVNS